jgi:hypothetical protein
MAATFPVNVRPGNAVTVNVTDWPGLTRPISASLTCAVTCGVEMSASVTIMLPVAVVELDALLELTGPPLTS